MWTSLSSVVLASLAFIGCQSESGLTWNGIYYRWGFQQGLYSVSADKCLYSTAPFSPVRLGDCETALGPGYLWHEVIRGGMTMRNMDDDYTSFCLGVNSNNLLIIEFPEDIDDKENTCAMSVNYNHYRDGATDKIFGFKLYPKSEGTYYCASATEDGYVEMVACDEESESQLFGFWRFENDPFKTEVAGAHAINMNHMEDVTVKSMVNHNDYAQNIMVFLLCAVLVINSVVLFCVLRRNRNKQ